MLQILILISSTSADPLPPLWPNVFWQDFEERTYYPGIGIHNNRGSFFYNYTLGAYNIYRDNGQYDRYCGLNGPQNPYANLTTPCSHIVNNGNRYLYYPELNQCCYCCNSTSGCGILLPSWFSDATYVDTEMHNGVLTYKWSKQGLQPNFIYETTQTLPLNRITVSIYQEDDDFMDFGNRRTQFDSKVFDLPNICHLSNTCNWGFCQQLRDGIQTQ